MSQLLTFLLKEKKQPSVGLDKAIISLTSSAVFARRMNGHSGAAERLLESAGVHMINTRDAKGR